MPAPKTGSGPWGEALKYWLPRRDMRQSDLARETGIEEKTISSIARGFHTTTRKLERIAEVLKVPIDDVLISPARRLAIEERRRIAQDVAERVLRELEADAQPPAEARQSFNDEMDGLVRAAERSVEQRHEPVSKKAQKTIKKRRV